jgi:hypothetical protein
VSVRPIRPLMPEDAGIARAFVRTRLTGTPYLARVEEQLESALQFEDPEYMALLATGEDGETLSALALFGTVAGARQCVKLHALVGDDALALTGLVESVEQLCESSNERLVVCELPDDAPWPACAAVLLANGYREEGRVPDYLRDGVALRLLVRRR